MIPYRMLLQYQKMKYYYLLSIPGIISIITATATLTITVTITVTELVVL